MEIVIVSYHRVRTINACQCQLCCHLETELETFLLHLQSNPDMVTCDSIDFLMRQ